MLRGGARYLLLPGQGEGDSQYVPSRLTGEKEGWNHLDKLRCAVLYDLFYKDINLIKWFFPPPLELTQGPEPFKCRAGS